GRAERPHEIRVTGLGAAGAAAGRSRIRLAGEPVRVELGDAAVIVPDSADETWAKIRFGDAAWPTVIGLIDKIADPAARLVIFNAARDAVRDAALAPAEAVPLLPAGARTDT